MMMMTTMMMMMSSSPVRYDETMFQIS